MAVHPNLNVAYHTEYSQSNPFLSSRHHDLEHSEIQRELAGHATARDRRGAQLRAVPAPYGGSLATLDRQRNGP